MDYLDIVPGQLQMPQGTSRPGISHMTLGSGKPRLDTCIPGLAPAIEWDSSPLQNENPIKPGSIYPCI
jgi:hypothetical protein